MCGIIGSINYDKQSYKENEEWIKSKISLLSSRSGQ